MKLRISTNSGASVISQRCIPQAQLYHPPTFVDYVSGGCEIIIDVAVRHNLVVTFLLSTVDISVDACGHSMLTHAQIVQSMPIAEIPLSSTGQQLLHSMFGDDLKDTEVVHPNPPGSTHHRRPISLRLSVYLAGRRAHGQADSLHAAVQCCVSQQILVNAGGGQTAHQRIDSLQ